MRHPIGLVAASLLVASSALAAGKGRNVIVRPGESIQAAVNAAQSGDTIVVKPGTYREAGTPCPGDPSATCAVVISKPGIALVGTIGRGRARTVLENPGGQALGIVFAPSGATPATCLDDPAQRLAGASVRGFTVNGFDAIGIFMLCVDGFSVRFSETNDNDEYGIFPSHATRGRIANNLATGSNDTGIYIGQARDVRVDHNVARGNVSGFEIENSSRVRLDHNVATGNTGGILSFALPFLDVKVNSNNRIDHNWVQGNNKPNTCTDPDDAVCGVPPGTGILALAADANQIDHNLVLGNDSYGIAVANFCLGSGLTPDECAALDIDPDSDGNHVLNNAVFGNGDDPSPLIAPQFAVDLAWDTTGDGNCWEKNAFGDSFPEDLPECD
jgi:parallel beta-helix repeat protein